MAGIVVTKDRQDNEFSPVGYRRIKPRQHAHGGIAADPRIGDGGLIALGAQHRRQSRRPGCIGSDAVTGGVAGAESDNLSSGSARQIGCDREQRHGDQQRKI